MTRRFGPKAPGLSMGPLNTVSAILRPSARATTRSAWISSMVSDSCRSMAAICSVQSVRLPPLVASRSEPVQARRHRSSKSRSVCLPCKEAVTAVRCGSPSLGKTRTIYMVPRRTVSVLSVVCRSDRLARMRVSAEGSASAGKIATPSLSVVTDGAPGRSSAVSLTPETGRTSSSTAITAKQSSGTSTVASVTLAVLSLQPTPYQVAKLTGAPGAISRPSHQMATALSPVTAVSGSVT